jgi:YHS domain-containing protein
MSKVWLYRLFLGLVVIAWLVFGPRLGLMGGGCCGLNRPQTFSANAVYVGNKICPVSGRTIGVMGPGVKEEYKGKVYTLCCGGCVSTFESDPEKYSKIAEAQTAKATTSTQ